MSAQSKGRYEGRFAAPKQKPARRLAGAALALVILLLSLSRLGAEAFKLLSYADVLIGGGKMLIYGNVESVDIGEAVNGVPVFNAVPEHPPEDYILRLDDGTTIVYKGHTYQLNPNLVTVLFLGIDHEVQETDVIGTGGQSDVLLLVGLDTKTGEATVLNISRDTYAQVDVYSIHNQFIETVNQQITMAYGYGNGKDTSCENAKRSVERLIYGLPISRYISLDMDGILAANETVGRVSLHSLIDVHMPDGSDVKAGDYIELAGRNLDRYIRTRGQELDANTRRMERQQQYVTEFVKKSVARTREQLSFPVDLFSTLAPYMATNLEISDVTFLSSAFINHGAHFSFRSVTGSYGKLYGSSVFYPDETDLFEAVLQVFYLRAD